MSDLCEQFCPVYETCIRAFDDSNATRNSLLDQRETLDGMHGLADIIDAVENRAQLADMTDEEIDQLRALNRARLAAAEEKIDHRISQSEANLGHVASVLMECATAQVTCPGPQLSFLGKVAVAARAIRYRRRPTEADRHTALEYFAKCSSAAAKAALLDLPEPPH